MKMKVSGLQHVELIGDVAQLSESDGYLVMNVKLDSPVGWTATAALTHRDLMTLVKLLLKPSALRYILFGFGKPRPLIRKAGNLSSLEPSKGEKQIMDSVMEQPIWKPTTERKKAANITRFIELVNERHKQYIVTYRELQEWSVNNIPDFWALMWEFGGIKASIPYESPVADFNDMLRAKWFPGARLNFAENLTKVPRRPSALIFKGENSISRRLTYAQLYEQVARLAKALKRTGVKAGDRVAGFMPNMTETVVAMLASTSLGAVWSSCSPDFGPRGILDRFQQIAPKVLFTADGYSYNGKVFDSLERVAAILPEIPSIEKVIVVPYVGIQTKMPPKSINYRDFISSETTNEIEFAQLPFDHPVYIVFSSGTTDKPKCIVHRAGGILIQHLKELILNTDMKREDTIFYYTTCGWVMWNWMVSSLSQGVTIVLYDGSPFYPDNEAMFNIVQDEKASLFGISPRYLAAVEKAGVKPAASHDLSHLKTMITTGSPLNIENYEYVYRDIKSDVYLNNISGGTEAIACFGIGNPIQSHLRWRNAGARPGHEGKCFRSRRSSLWSARRVNWYVPLPSLPCRSNSGTTKTTKDIEVPISTCTRMYGDMVISPELRKEAASSSADGLMLRLNRGVSG